MGRFPVSGLWFLALPALLLAFAAPASAQVLPPPPPPPGPPPGPPPPPPESTGPDRITILAIFKTIEFGERAFVSGRFRRLENPDAEVQPYAGRKVTLEEAPFPFTAFTPVASATTDRDGYYAFASSPQLHTRYRVVSADPPVQSEAKLIRVRLHATLEAGSDSVRKGRSVRLSGQVEPAHSGNRVEIQRRTKAGRWQTVARATLRTSGWVKRVRMRSDGVFRARVLGHEDHLPGISEQVFVDVSNAED